MATGAPPSTRHSAVRNDWASAVERQPRANPARAKPCALGQRLSGFVGSCPSHRGCPAQRTAPVARMVKVLPLGTIS